MKLLIIFLIFHISTKLTSATVSEHSSIGGESNDVSMQNEHKGEENVLENRNESIFEESGENLQNPSVNGDKRDLEEIDEEEKSEPREIEDDGNDGKLGVNKSTNGQEDEIENDLEDEEENITDESFDRKKSRTKNRDKEFDGKEKFIQQKSRKMNGGAGFKNLMKSAFLGSMVATSGAASFVDPHELSGAGFQGVGNGQTDVHNLSAYNWLTNDMGRENLKSGEFHSQKPKRKLGENREAENSPEVVENGTWDKNPEMVKMAETASEWEKENGFELANYKFDKDIQEGKKKKDKITPNEHEHREHFRHLAQLTGDYLVHDPTIVQLQDNTYIVYSTHNGMEARKSPNLKDWQKDYKAFKKGTGPSIGWAKNWTRNNPNEFWAPDISFYNNQYYLYYSVPRDADQCQPRCTHSAAIGFAISPTGKPDSWKDHGPIIFSNENSNYNAIDPNLFVDEHGWVLTFGSFWSGIQQVDLDNTGRPKKGAIRRTIATRPVSKSKTQAIEAPFLYKKGNFYYLFVSFDRCCAGIQSTYSIHVGRGTSPSGPFFDDTNTNMLNGGGKLVLDRMNNEIGPGGQSIFWDRNLQADIMVYHYYDGNDNGVAKLGIKKLVWQKNGWPLAENLPGTGKRGRKLLEIKKKMKNKRNRQNDGHGHGRKHHRGGIHRY